MLNNSRWRKVLATLAAVAGFVAAYETTILDSRFSAREVHPRADEDLPAPGTRLSFGATAYCKGLTTTSGVPVQSGVVAADPQLLPVGSVVELGALAEKY